MRLLFLLTQDLESPSGAGRFFPLARGLAQRGHQVSIATLHSNYGALKERHFRREGVEVHYVAPMHVRKQGDIKTYYPAYRLLPLMAWATAALSRAALGGPYDLVHVGKPHPMNGVAGLLARRLRGRRVWLDVDDYEAATNRFSGGWQRRLVTGFEDSLPLRVDGVTTHTTFLRRRLLALGVPEERIAYLPNGFDPERFSPPPEERVAALRAELGLEGCKVAAFIGSLSLSSHPVNLLVEAFERVAAEEPAARLLLVGGGEDLPRIRALVEGAGLSDRVIFRGRVPFSEAALYYRLADLTLDPVNDDDAARSRQPLKLFESLACGVPFVSADVGDRRLLLGSPPAGLLARPGDPRALAEAVLELFRRPDLAAEMGRRGPQQVRAYRWERIAEELEKQYLRSLG